MNIKFTPNVTIINQVYEFSRLYERLYMLDRKSIWFNKLQDIMLQKAALSSIITDKSIYQNIDFINGSFDISKNQDTVNIQEVNYYKKTILDLANFTKIKEINIDNILEIHQKILGVDQKQKFRSKTRDLQKILFENKIKKTLSVPVKTRPIQIKTKINNFLTWLNQNLDFQNPLILTALSHLILVSIHPFEDGNGRLARIVDNLILAKTGFEFYNILSLEEFFLINIDRYYNLIENTIETGDYTNWIEFFTAGFLETINELCTLLKKISGNSVDLFEHKVINLEIREQEVLENIIQRGQASGAEIGRIMKLNRQTVNIITQKLRRLDLIEKFGEHSGARYKVKG